MPVNDVFIYGSNRTKKPKNPFVSPRARPPKAIHPSHGKCTCCGSQIR